MATAGRPWAGVGEPGGPVLALLPATGDGHGVERADEHGDDDLDVEVRAGLSIGLSGLEDVAHLPTARFDELLQQLLVDRRVVSAFDDRGAEHPDVVVARPAFDQRLGLVHEVAAQVSRGLVDRAFDLVGDRGDDQLVLRWPPPVDRGPGHAGVTGHQVDRGALVAVTAQPQRGGFQYRVIGGDVPGPTGLGLLSHCRGSFQGGSEAVS